MKLKHLPILYVIYLLVLLIIFGTIKVLDVVMTLKVLLSCGVVFLCLTATTVAITLTVIKDYNKLQLELKNEAVKSVKRSSQDELRDYLSIFQYYSVDRQPTGTLVGETQIQVRRLLDKLANLYKLLDSTFSKTDLTYVTYKDSLESVLKLFIGNLRGIRKRVEVFDYESWAVGDRNEISQKYLKDMEQMYNQNETILDSMDSLISELVSLDDVSDFSLDTINNLIEQTQDYKSLVRDE